MSQFQWQSRKIQPGTGGTFGRPGNLSQNVVALNELKFTLHQRLIEELDPNKLEGLGKEKAREIYKAARPGYHPIAVTTMDEILK